MSKEKTNLGAEPATEKKPLKESEATIEYRQACKDYDDLRRQLMGAQSDPEKYKELHAKLSAALTVKHAAADKLRKS